VCDWCVAPESFELVKGTSLRMEEVHHKIHEIDQHPASPRDPLDVVRAVAMRSQSLEHRVTETPNVGI
jgi:hypothetical protein